MQDPFTTCRDFQHEIESGTFCSTVFLPVKSMPAHQRQCCLNLSILALIWGRFLAVTLAAWLLIYDNMQSSEA